MDERPDPESTRRVGVPASPIALADGREWGLALPSVRLRPRVERGVDALGRPIESIRVEAEFGYPIEIRSLVDGLRLACEGDREDLRYEALVGLAAGLLRRAHEIDLSTASGLLELDLDGLDRLVEAVLAAVSGPGVEGPASPRKANSDV